jgi:predicted RNA-binding protein
MTELHSNALQTIIGEFKNISPEITNAFIFEANGEIVASDGVTIDTQSKNLVAAFNCISSKAEIMGKVKTVTMQGGDRQLSISCINNRYLATVFSNDADEKIIKSLTYVLIPAVLGLVDDLSETPLPETIEPENKRIEEVILRPQEPLPAELVSEEPYTFSSEPSLPEPPVTQLMIEKIVGLFVSPDMVRVNSDVIAKWNNLYDNKKITNVQIETLEGKKLTCKFKAVKEAKGNSHGVIQMPEKILQTLQTSKGKLVMVKPVIT